MAQNHAQLLLVFHFRAYRDYKALFEEAAEDRDMVARENESLSQRLAELETELRDLRDCASRDRDEIERLTHAGSTAAADARLERDEAMMRADQAQARLDEAREACEELVRHQEEAIAEQGLAAVQVSHHNKEKEMDANAALQRQLMKNSSLERALGEARKELEDQEERWLVRLEEAQEIGKRHAGAMEEQPTRPIGEEELKAKWSAEVHSDKTFTSSREITRLMQEVNELQQGLAAKEAELQAVHRDHQVALKAVAKSAADSVISQEDLSGLQAALQEATAATKEQEQASREAHQAAQKAHDKAQEERMGRDKERSDRIKVEHERNMLREALRCEQLKAATLNDEVDAFQFNAREERARNMGLRQRYFLAVTRLLIAYRHWDSHLACVLRWAAAAREARVEDEDETLRGEEGCTQLDSQR